MACHVTAHCDCDPDVTFSNHAFKLLVIMLSYYQLIMLMKSVGFEHFALLTYEKQTTAPWPLFVFSMEIHYIT